MLMSIRRTEKETSAASAPVDMNELTEYSDSISVSPGHWDQLYKKLTHCDTYHHTALDGRKDLYFISVSALQKNCTFCGILWRCWEHFGKSHPEMMI
jgi:hypothetical protein